MCQEDLSMEILETQERKMNKNKEKKRGLTHFLGHYPLPKSVKGHGLSTERPITILQKE